MAMGSEAPTTNNGYGLTETQGPAMECVELGGMHQPSPEQFFFEVIDRDTGEPLPDGEPGMMLVSHLNRRGTVMLRYVGGDVVALSHETCPHCGRTEPRFLGSPRRADGFTKVKGTLINIGSLQDELAGLMRRGVSEYQLVLTTQDRSDPALAGRHAASDRLRSRGPGEDRPGDQGRGQRRRGDHAGHRVPPEGRFR